MITEHDLVDQLGRLSAETTQITAHLHDVGAQLRSLRTNAAQFKQFAALLQAKVPPAESDPLDERRQWLLGLISSVIVSPTGQIRVIWRLNLPGSTRSPDSACTFITGFELPPIQRYARPSERPARYRMVNFSIYLNEDLRDRMNERAQSLGINDSEFLRRALSHYLDAGRCREHEPSGPYPYARGFSFPRELAARVEEASRRCDRPVTVIMRAALFQYLEYTPSPGEMN